tara:strand:+ start:445 stop:672 length:228 start_codon:yes stop_codon:yes gene_type:complete
MVSGLTPQTFCQEIESLVVELKTDYMDAVVHYCEKNNIELETAASIIKSNSKFKAIIQNEGEDLNLLPKTAKLPL